MSPEPGDGTVIVYDTIKNRYKPSAVALEGGEPGTVFTTDDDGVTGWLPPSAGGTLFRGAWAAGDLAKQFSFSDGLLPEGFSVNGVGPGIHDVVFGSATDNAYNFGYGNVGTPGPYETCAVVQINHIGIPVYTDLILDVSALGLGNVVQATAWMCQHGYNGEIKGNAKHEMRVNNASASASANGDVVWTKRSASVTNADTLTFRAFSTYGAGPFGSGTLNVGVTGIELFTSAAPYMTGQFVTHEGDMYKSLVDNNAQTPAKTATQWERALTLPPVRGTTAQRPNAATADKGFQYYDETLSKPIWSDGAVWKDATASTV